MIWITIFGDHSLMEEVCGDPQNVVDFIFNNQPIRSSYAGGTEPTGLVRAHPTTGIPVDDTFDCDPVPGPGEG